MNTDHIRDMYEYNYWANQRILDTAEKITPEQLVAPTSCSYGSLHGTLVHTLDAEWGWRLRLQGQPADGELKPADFPTLVSLRQRWDEDETDMWRYIDGLSDQDIAGIIGYPIGDGVIRERPLWHCLYHVVNHGTQHRSEAAAMLTDYGQSPGDIDFTVFLNERKARLEQ